MNPSELTLSYKVEPLKGNEKQFELGGLQTYSATYLRAKQNHGVFQVISDETFLCEISCLPVFVAKKRMPFNMDTTGMRDI